MLNWDNDSDKLKRIMEIVGDLATDVSFGIDKLIAHEEFVQP
jgi:hypothetical protein